MQFFNNNSQDNPVTLVTMDNHSVELPSINPLEKSPEGLIGELLNLNPDQIQAVFQSYSMLDLYELALYLDKEIKKAKERCKHSDKVTRELAHQDLMQKKIVYKLVKKIFAHYLRTSMLYSKVKADAKAYIKAHQKPLLKRLAIFMQNLMGQHGPRNKKIRLFRYHLQYQHEAKLMSMAKEANTYLDMLGKEQLAQLLKVSRVEIASCKIDYVGNNQFAVEMTRLTSRISGLGTEKYTLSSADLQKFLQERRTAQQLNSSPLQLSIRR